MSRKKQDKSYFKAMLALAPISAARSVLGDLPKAAVESVVDQKVRGSKVPALTIAGRAIRGKGLGRVLGATAGALTFPLYVRGMSMMSSKKKSDQKKGLGLLLGSTAAYGGVKGIGEGTVAGRMGGMKGIDALKSGMRLGMARSLVKLLPAVVSSAVIAKSRSQRKKDENPLLKALKPAVAGAVTGSASRAAEHGIRSLMNKNTVGLGKRLKGKALSGAAAGALGGLVLDKVLGMAEGK